MIATANMSELQAVCPGATEMSEGGRTFVHLPLLKLPEGCAPPESEALLCITEHSGYTSRLFLAQPANRGGNWTAHVVLGRTWHTWSWNNVPASLRPTEILTNHLRGLR
jgi:hypothetical protein